MIYYDEDGNAKIINKGRKFYQVHDGDMEYIKSSKIYSGIYRLGLDKCIKILDDKNNVDLEMMKTVRGLNIAGLYQLRDFLFNMDDKFVAYMMDYYKRENIDLFSQGVDYTIYNYLRLERAMKLLGDNLICVNDLHDGNVILTDSEIIMIDIDNYYRGDKEEKVKRYNLRRLNELFITLYKCDLAHYYGRYYKSVERSIEEVFTSSDKMVKTLSKYKCPGEYFMKWL